MNWLEGIAIGFLVAYVLHYLVNGFSPKRTFTSPPPTTKRPGPKFIPDHKVPADEVWVLDDEGKVIKKLKPWD